MERVELQHLNLAVHADHICEQVFECLQTLVSDEGDVEVGHLTWNCHLNIQRLMKSCDSGKVTKTVFTWVRLLCSAQSMHLLVQGQHAQQNLLKPPALLTGTIILVVVLTVRAIVIITVIAIVIATAIVAVVVIITA